MKLSSFLPATSLKGLALSLLAALPSVSGFALDPNDNASLKKGAFIASHGMMSDYPGNKTGGIPGLWGDPYYWWEAGAAFGALIDYWYYTGDEGFNPVVMQAMLHQVGAGKDYKPDNQSKSLGNDDQGFWGLAAMTAAEKKFPNPPADQPQWLALAQAVFNTQAQEWDNATCGGGQRWQIFSFNNGYDYKNTISNGIFFQLGARLARYTGNHTYAHWAETSWDWSEKIGLISPEYKYFDGTDVNINCTRMNHIQWSYNAGVYLAGTAYMYNYTDSIGEKDKAAMWKKRVQGTLDAIEVFFRPPTDIPEGSQPDTKVMFEIACEPNGKCNVDQRSFKAYLSRFMALTVKMAPFTHDQILSRLAVSAVYAAKSCSGGSDQVTCGRIWYDGGHDGSVGLGEQMCALEVIQSNLIDTVPAPVTSKDGISQGDPAAGTGQEKALVQRVSSPNSTGDRVGASVLTIVVIGGLVGGAWWMVI